MTDRNRHGIIARALAANRREVLGLEERLAQRYAEAEELREQLADRRRDRTPPPMGPDIGALHAAYRSRHR